MKNSKFEIQALEKDFDSLEELYSDFERAKYISKEKYNFKRKTLIKKQFAEVKNLIKSASEDGNFEIAIDESKFDEDIYLLLVEEGFFVGYSGFNNKYYISWKENIIETRLIEAMDCEIIPASFIPTGVISFIVLFGFLIAKGWSIYIFIIPVMYFLISYFIMFTFKSIYLKQKIKTLKLIKYNK